MPVRNVEDVLAQLEIRVANVGPSEIAAHCPFHADSHPSFSINAQTGLWICYQCTESGTLEMLVEKVGGTIDVTAYLRESRQEGLKKKPKKVVAPEPEPEVEEAPEPLMLFAQYETFGYPPRWAREERMLTDEATELYGLRWDHGWIIPIWSSEGKDLLGWQFKRPGFFSNYPKAVKKSTALFGLKELDGNKFALVESPLDVVRLASINVPAVSSYGAMVSRVQIRLLVEYADELMLALDDDEEGNRQNAKLYRLLNRFVPTMVADLGGVKDPGEQTNKQAIRTFYDLQRHRSAVSRRSHRHDARQGLSPVGPRNGAR